MKRILLLGGTGDALQIARQLGRQHIYSLAGLGREPEGLVCSVRIGGFGGSDGLATYIAEEHIGLVIDATHPYAAQMSANAAAACSAARVPCWALRRAGWTPQADDDWCMVDNWNALTDAIRPFRRVLFTSGRAVLAHLDEIPAHQYWIVRCLDAHAGNERARVIDARGPFDIDGERALFALNHIDVLVTKNSGGDATRPKLDVARELKVPVVMMRRPVLPDVDREFDSPLELLRALNEEGSAGR